MKRPDMAQLGWAAVGVVAGLVVYNNLQRLTSGMFVGRVMDGSLLRRA